tara:strand:+ start:1424 stop:1696 length:273 start_codon:yes stop_codon:yes gene_type:complete
MTEPTISDLNAAYAELEHWGKPILSTYGGSVRMSLQDIRICPGFTGEVKGSGSTLSAAIYAALEQLRVVRATVPPIPRDIPVVKEQTNDL